MLWLNEKHIEEVSKYHSDHREHRYELVNEPKKTTKRNFYKQRISNQSNH